MALFGWRRRHEPAGSPRRLEPADVEQFWYWWAGAEEAVTAAFEDGVPHRVETPLDVAVGALDPGLTWHVGPGVRARYMLVVSGARHPALRVVAERWRRGGPLDSPSWEFHPAMPAESAAFDSVVEVAGVELEPQAAMALAGLDDARFRMDLTVHHPVFSQLDQAARTRIANVLVGWAVGEDDTDRWVGRIDTTTTRPLDTVPVAMLGSLTSQLAGRWGGERWATLEGAFGRVRLIAHVRHPLHRVDHPLFDEHIAVRLPYHTSQADGLPDDDAEQALARARAGIEAPLRTDAVLVAAQTASGERLLHFYADSWASPVDAVREALGRVAPPGAGVQVNHDPGWDAVAHLRLPIAGG